MLVIADTAFAQVQPTPTTMLKCFKELYDATWFFAFLARAYDELLHVNSSRRYPLISPCREAQYLRRTLDSVAAQSVPPALWVLVDDGSTDETPAILEEYARRLPYLRVIRRTDRGGACSVVAGHPGSRLTRIISRASRHPGSPLAEFM